MRTMCFLVALACAAPALPAAAHGVPPFEGNDTGGIIAWSPEAQRNRQAIARDHCARYGKAHRITSLYAKRGQYIGFACYWPRGSGAVLRARY